MLYRFLIAALAAFALVGLPALTLGAEWGTLKGRFVYDGQPPKPMKANVNKDVEVFGDKNLVDESLLVGPERGIANVVIYVRTPNVPINPALEKKYPDKVVYDNKNGRFEPHIITVWIPKQTVVMNNSDLVAHNINVQPLGDTGINPLLPAGGQVQHQFNRQQSIPVPVGCNIHPWMRGYILPRNNPYAAVSQEDGTFVIEGLPTGELEFQVWQEKAGYLETPKWEKGRFKYTIKPGVNDLGEIKISPKAFEK